MGWQNRRAYRRNPAQALCLILAQSLLAVGLENSLFSAQRRRDLPAVGRRKEIGEDFSDLPETGRLFVNLFFGVQRKTLCVFASLRANFFFFPEEQRD